MVQEVGLNRMWHKFYLLLVKIIPMIIAFCYFLNTVLNYFGVDTETLSIIGGTSCFALIYLYASSYTFKFCEYHRMFLHYIVINDIITWIDYNYTIPVTNLEYLVVHVMLVFICMIIMLYLKQKKT